MKKPYIKKIGKFFGFVAWIVDGKYIRDNLDEEFTNFGQDADFNFIPKNEFWIDKEQNENETRYFIEHMLAENKLIRQGKSADEAFEIAGKIERAERRKSKLIKQYIKNKVHKKEILEKIHKKLLKKYSQKIKVWIVRGDIARSLFFIDFTEGGHDKVYSFVPKNEVWIDDDLSPRELKFVLLHELHERNLMIDGWPYWSYSNKKRSAHASASKIEFFCRKHPKIIDDKIKNELNKVKL